MTAHVHHLSEECVARMVRMQRIDLGVLRAVQVIHVVALQGLVQKGDAKAEDQQADEQELLAQHIKVTTNRRPMVALAGRNARPTRIWQNGGTP